MTATMATYDEVLKEVYEPSLHDQLESETVTLLRVQRSAKGIESDSVGGKYVRFPIRVERNHGVGSRAENVPLPVARRQRYRDVRINLTHLYGGIELTGQQFRLARTNEQAFASALDQEVNGMRETLQKDLNRQVYGTPTGILATASSASGGDDGVFKTLNAQYLEIGMVVDIYNTAGPPAIIAGGAGAIISDIVEDSPGEWWVSFVTAADETVPFAGSIPSGGTLTRRGSRGTDIHGFNAIVGTGALYGLTHPLWESTIDATGGPVSEGRMTKMVDDIRRKGGGNPTVIFTTTGVRRAYANLLMQQRRYTNTTSFAGGFSGLEFTTDKGVIPVMSDDDCPPGNMYYINEKQLKVYRDADWSFMDMDGSRWSRVVRSDGDYDAYKAMYFQYLQLGTFRRNSHGLATGITEANG